MATDNLTTPFEMFAHFKQLTYINKLSYFHARFGIIPFPFAEFDVKISWYNNEILLNQLTENFYKENRKKYYHEQTITENNSTFRFIIQPTTSAQRALYNGYIISTFLKLNERIKEAFEKGMKDADDPLTFLNSRLQLLYAVKEWMEYSFNRDKAKTSLKDQFLHIFFNGMIAHQTGRQTISSAKRKFAELYLFSEGIFFADLIAMLESWREQKRNIDVFTYSLSLPDKINLLHELGIIDYLKDRCKSSDADSYHCIAKVICILTSQDPGSHHSILAYLLSLKQQTNVSSFTHAGTPGIHALFQNLVVI